MEKEKIKKPRVRFCWECGRKLRGNHYAERKLPYQDETIILHKACAEAWDKDLANPYERTY